MEQGKSPGQTNTSSIITFIALMALTVIIIIIAVFAPFKKDDSNVYIDKKSHIVIDLDTTKVERERAWRAGDTLILGPNGSLMLKPEGMETPDFFGVVKDNQDSGFITTPGKVRNLNTTGK